MPRLSYKYTLKIVTAGGTLAISSTCKQNSSMAREKFEDCGDERPQRLREEQKSCGRDPRSRQEDALS